MTPAFTPSELAAIQPIVQSLCEGSYVSAIPALRTLQDSIYAAIPPKQRIGRGITWVLQRISNLICINCVDDAQLQAIALGLTGHLPESDRLFGVPIFLLADYGQRHPVEILPFFEHSARSEDWVVREFAQGGFRFVIRPQKNFVLPWLQQIAQAPNPYLRRFAAESLRPVTVNRWLLQAPEYSLSVLRLMFREHQPYPRTSVGNNLSDLSRRQPELIFSIVNELMSLNDPNSSWIAYRACRNLVKVHPQRVLDLLGVDEYHYKDRNVYHQS
jgi:3-methyladenine DNA glycosylase AlkC